MAIVLKAIRQNDQKILYFKDQESYDDYVLAFEDEVLSEPQFCFDLPFGEKVIDWDQSRANMSTLLKLNGLSMKDVTKTDILGTDTKDHSYEDTPKRMKEYRKLAKHTFDLQNGELIENDDDYREITIRKNKARNNDIFKNFIDALDDTRKNAVADVFAQHNLNLDKLDEYFDTELNMDISIWLQDYDTEKAFLIALKSFKQTDDYKVHDNFMKAMEASYEAVRKMDIDNDHKNLIPTVDLSDPQANIISDNDDLDNKVAVNGKLQTNAY